MKFFFISIVALLVLCSNLSITRAADKQVSSTVAQIQCPNGSTRGISLEVKNSFAKKESKLQKLSRRAEQHYRLISRREKDILTSTQRCAAGITTACTAVEVKTTELDWEVGLYRKAQKEFLDIQAEVSAKKDALCTATVPTISIISQ